MTLLALTFVVFGLMYLAPGDPAEKRLLSQGIAVTREMLTAERERLGLFRPFLTRFGEWLFAVLRGDLGVSFKDDLPVLPKLLAALQNTAILAGASLALSLLVAFPLSILCAYRKGRLSDHVIGLFSFLGNSLPSFLLSVLLMYFLCIRIDLFPVIATGDFSGLILPVLSLAIPMTGRFIRLFRAELLLQLSMEYVTGLRNRGLKERYIIRNILHNALGHLLVLIGLQIGSLFSGSVVIETIFRWPGIGKLVMDAITARDYPVIQGFVLLIGAIYLLINQLTDVVMKKLDPRIEVRYD